MVGGGGLLDHGKLKITQPARRAEAGSWMIMTIIILIYEMQILCSAVDGVMRHKFRKWQNQLNREFA